MLNILPPVLPELTEFPALFYNVALGDNLTVSCSAEGRPTPNITWEKDDFPLMSSEIANINISFSEGKSELVITDFTNSSSGIYSCIATNDVGNDSWIFQVEAVSELLYKRFNMGMGHYGPRHYIHWFDYRHSIGEWNGDCNHDPCKDMLNRKIIMSLFLFHTHSSTRYHCTIGEC